MSIWYVLAAHPNGVSPRPYHDIELFTTLNVTPTLMVVTPWKLRRNLYFLVHPHHHLPLPVLLTVTECSWHVAHLSPLVVGNTIPLEPVSEKSSAKTLNPKVVTCGDTQGVPHKCFYFTISVEAVNSSWSSTCSSIKTVNRFILVSKRRKQGKK